MRYGRRKVSRVVLSFFLMLSVHEGLPFVAWGFQPNGVVFPGVEDRINVMAVGVVLLGGLIFLLNRLRQEADRRAQRDDK